jgi:molybdenum cofactor cytidylyltransferase
MERCELILLASGFSRRYGKNKLLEDWNGVPMYRHTLNLLQTLAKKYPNCHSLVVTQYPEIQAECEKSKIPCYHNDRAEEGISASIRLAIRHTQGDYALFFVADQPELTLETAEGLLSGFLRSGKGLASVTWNDQLGNPCGFSKTYFPALLALEGDKGGKKIIKAHMDDVFLYPVSNPKELEDIDTPR